MFSDIKYFCQFTGYKLSSWFVDLYFPYYWCDGVYFSDHLNFIFEFSGFLLCQFRGIFMYSEYWCLSYMLQLPSPNLLLAFNHVCDFCYYVEMNWTFFKIVVNIWKKVQAEGSSIAASIWNTQHEGVAI